MHLNISLKKNSLCFCLFVFAATSVDAQITKFRANILSLVLLDTTGNFVFESKEEKSNVLIVVDANKEKITIYTSQPKVLSVVSTTTYKDKYGFTWALMQCVDWEGTRCGVRLVWYNGTEQDGHTASLYIDYAHEVVVYRLVNE